MRKCRPIICYVSRVLFSLHVLFPPGETTVSFYLAVALSLIVLDLSCHIALLPPNIASVSVT